MTFVQDNPDADLHACFIAIKNTVLFGIKLMRSNRSMMWMRRFASILLHVLKAHPRQFDSDKLQLNISIPQITWTRWLMITSAPRVGMRINALTINYDFSGSHTLRSDYGSQETDTGYLNLRNGLNIGP